MIKDIFKVHDTYSIEIKQSYYSLFKRKQSDYRVITYIFVPNALNINTQTYSKEQFYKDIRLNVRYSTPEYSLDDILNNEQSPLNKLVDTINVLPNRPNKKQLSKIEVLDKIFATVISSSIREVNKTVKAEYKKDDDVSTIKNFTKKIALILKKYRISINKIDKLKITQYQKDLLYFGDEYISNIIEHEIIILHDFISKIKGENKEKLNLLIKLLEQEQQYKVKKYYGNVDIKNLNPENIIYKRSQLKKYVDSVLFLNKNIKKDGAVAEHSIFAIAAGLAMLFSTGIAFYYQQKYGNFTFTFFIALIVSYMFKDRIKGLLGGLFISKAHSLFYDYKIEVLNSENNKVGKIKQNFSYISFKKLGFKIKKYRFRNKILNVDEDLFGEQIIQYKKRVVLYPKKLGREISDEKLNSLVDITRINFFRFTNNMDNPKKSYFIVKNDKIENIMADRVYHINIIQKFYTEEGIEFKRYRVVINRDGIKRIEKIKQKGLNVLAKK